MTKRKDFTMVLKAISALFPAITVFKIVLQIFYAAIANSIQYYLITDIPITTHNLIKHIDISSLFYAI